MDPGSMVKCKGNPGLVFKQAKQGVGKRVELIELIELITICID